MLRMSATACSSRPRIAPKPSVACIRRDAAGRGLSRPLSRAWPTTLQALSMSLSSSAARAIQSSTSPVTSPRRSAAAMSHSSSPTWSSISVDLVRGAAVAQRRPHEQIDEQADRDPDAGVEQSRHEHLAVVARAGGEHDERGRRRRDRLRAQPVHRAGQQGEQDRHAERQRVEAEHGADERGDEDADHRRAHLLDPPAQRAVDRGVDGHQRGPRRQERLREVEHLVGEHPRDDRRRDRLDELRRVRPRDGIPHPLHPVTVRSACARELGGVDRRARRAHGRGGGDARAAVGDGAARAHGVAARCG